MKRLVSIIAIICLSCGAIFASEEDILPPRKVSLSADGGKAFGEVTAVMETTGKGEDYHIKAMTLTVGDKKFDVPEEQFRDLREPLLNTVEFRTEAGRSGKPLLYLCFRTTKQGVKSVADFPRVYIRFQNGKLLERHIHDPNGQKTDD